MDRALIRNLVAKINVGQNDSIVKSIISDGQAVKKKIDFPEKKV